MNIKKISEIKKSLEPNQSEGFNMEEWFHKHLHISVKKITRIMNE